MNLDSALASLHERARAYARHAPTPATLARASLGLMILLAGIHKLLAPEAWALYVTDWLAPWLVVTPIQFMLANGYLEIAFGIALLFDRYTAVAAFVAAVSLTVTVIYLALVGLLENGLFGDVLVRDVGLAGLAWGVLADALSR